MLKNSKRAFRETVLQSWQGVAFVGKPGFFDSFNKAIKMTLRAEAVIGDINDEPR